MLLLFLSSLRNCEAMLRTWIVPIVIITSACQSLAPIEQPINSCSLVSSAKQSGGLMPNDVQEFNQCTYRCPNGQTKTNTQFAACAMFIY